MNPDIDRDASRTRQRRVDDLLRASENARARAEGLRAAVQQRIEVSEALMRISRRFFAGDSG
ncbi:MAG TPA: hypothetical protein VGF58_06040 [Burkholderiales bacterium]|jgi:hypothetical protein